MSKQGLRTEQERLLDGEKIFFGTDDDFSIAYNESQNRLEFTSESSGDVAYIPLDSSSDLSSAGTEIEVQDDGSVSISDLETLNFGSNLSVSGSGNKVTVSGTSGGSIDVLDDGASQGSVDTIDFTNNLNASVSGNTATVSGTGGGSGNAREVGPSMGAVTVPGNDNITMWRGNAPAGTSLKVYNGSVTMVNSGTSPSQIFIDLNNITDSTTQTLISGTYESGDPLKSVDVGGDDFEIRLRNTQSGTKVVSPDIGARLD